VATCARPTFHALLFDFPKFFRSAGNVKLFAVNVTIAVCRCWKMCCCVVCRLIKSPKHLDRFRIRRPPPIRQMRDTRYEIPTPRYKIHLCKSPKTMFHIAPLLRGSLLWVIHGQEDLFTGLKLDLFLFRSGFKRYLIVSVEFFIYFYLAMKWVACN